MRRSCRDGGFALVELTVVVLIIGILVAIALPVYARTRETARRKACFANQRVIEGAVQQYAARSDGDLSGIVGIIDGNHPFIHNDIFVRPPSCPAAPKPANTMMPTAAEGAYLIKADGSVGQCTFGTPAHGLYH